ncbi:MAG: hypothetical protein LBL76_04905 [Treponema sp.]|jgi:hypothetical protein|nr:hypothetical protein [Treponema sp.]
MVHWLGLEFRLTFSDYLRRFGGQDKGFAEQKPGRTKDDEVWGVAPVPAVIATRFSITE